MKPCLVPEEFCWSTLNMFKKLVKWLQQSVRKTFSIKNSNTSGNNLKMLKYLKVILPQIFKGIQKSKPYMWRNDGGLHIWKYAKPFYRGIGVERISKNFQEIYKLLVLNHESHQTWLTKQAQGI